MNYIKINHLSLLIIAFLVASNLFGGSSGMFGALDRTTVSNPWTFTGAVTMSSTLTQTGDATFGGGSGAIVVTTTNTATSSVQVGCVQTTATSTATPIKIVLSSIATSSPAFGDTTIGLVGWKYGSCP